MGKNRVLFKFNEAVRERFIEKLIFKQKPIRDEGSRNWKRTSVTDSKEG